MNNTFAVISSKGRQHKITPDLNRKSNNIEMSRGSFGVITEVGYLLEGENNTKPIRLVKKSPKNNQNPINTSKAIFHHSKFIDMGVSTFPNMYTDGESLFTPNLNVDGRIVLSCNNQSGLTYPGGLFSFSDQVEKIIMDFKNQLESISTSEVLCIHADIYGFEIDTNNEKPEITSIKVIDYDNIEIDKFYDRYCTGDVLKPFLIFVCLFFKKYGIGESFNECVELCNTIGTSPIPEDIDFSRKFGFN